MKEVVSLVTKGALTAHNLVQATIDAYTSICRGRRRGVRAAATPLSCPVNQRGGDQTAPENFADSGSSSDPAALDLGRLENSFYRVSRNSALNQG
jgi:hypothetical protein